MLASELQSPRSVRERLAEQVQGLIGSGEVFFFKFARVDGVNHYTGFTGALNDDTRAVVSSRMDGRPSLVTKLWQPSQVPRHERNRFQRISPVLDDLERTAPHLSETFYGPLEITRGCRTRLYDGGRFIGYIGCVRRGVGAKDFSHDELTRLDRFAEHLKSGILAAERLEPNLPTPACGVFNCDRARLDWVSADVRPWFTDARLDYLRFILREEELPPYVVIDGQIVRFSRLEGQSGHRVMVSLERSEDPRLDPGVDLASPRQEAPASSTGATEDDVVAMLNRLPTPALIVSDTLEVVCFNRQARRLLSDAECLQVRHGRLQTARSCETSALRTAVADALAPANGLFDDLDAAPHVVGIRRAARLPLDVLAMPLRSQQAPRRSPARALLMIYDPESRPSINPLLIELLFGLTSTEACVAARLAEGRSIADIARARRCSTSTVRTHVKHIFQKTHTHRQAELVQLILTSPAISFER